MLFVYNMASGDVEPQYPKRKGNSKLHEYASIIIPINHSYSEWSSVFSDEKMTTVLLEQLTQHCHIIETKNESCIFKNSTSIQ